MTKEEFIEEITFLAMRWKEWDGGYGLSVDFDYGKTAAYEDVGHTILELIKNLEK